MTWRTHTLLGVNMLWLLTPLPPALISYDLGTLAACAALGALLPDLDATESKIKHLRLLGTNLEPLLLPAQIVSRSDRHRGLLHSIVGWGVVALFTSPLLFWISWVPVAALLFGYGSHLVADACTKSGIPLLYPRLRRFYLLPRLFRISTGSLAEEMLLPFLAVTVLLLLLT
ncbi:MAG: metal-dependent hydrolase [Abitibacteriaceae bacterium]|nr:metal-dependent hydrolase [Abditibacteriaceae bacterium]